MRERESESWFESPLYEYLNPPPDALADVTLPVHRRSHHHQPDIAQVKPPNRQELRLLAFEDARERAREEARKEAEARKPAPVIELPVAAPPPRQRERKPSAVQAWLSRRAREGWSVEGQHAGFVEQTEAFWDFLAHRYFRTTTTGWERLPDGGSLLIGVHAGTWLTMDAWMLMAEWWLHFRGKRVLHGTAHDVLMAMPGIGTLFRKGGVVPAARDCVGACLQAGHSVVVWPGGEVDSMRSWRRRHEVDLGGRKGFVRQAIRSGVPIVPVATVGGADTVFVLSEGRWLAKTLGLKRLLRSEMAPIVAGLPFGIWLEAFPSHIPLPAKITNEILEPVAVEQGREDDDAYVDALYAKVQGRIQEGVHRLAACRRWPVIG